MDPASWLRVSKGVEERRTRKQQRFRMTYARWESLHGWLLVLPWVFGFLVFTAGPMIVSAYLAFTRWDLFTSPQWIGLGNLARMVFEDKSARNALRVTTIYAFASVPLNVVFGVGVALLLNQDVKAQSFIRTVYYLPSVVAGVAVALLWRWVYSPDFGLLNALLALVGIKGPAWLADARLALPSLIAMSLWSVGGSMVIYLAGLHSVPTALYDASEIDGANAWRRFWNITLPMITPVIFFQTIMGIIGALQTFTQAYIMTDGGPKDATLFFMLHLYRNAFRYLKMGYASALAWVLFAYIMILTLLVLRSSAVWVYYEAEGGGR